MSKKGKEVELSQLNTVVNTTPPADAFIPTIPSFPVADAGVGVFVPTPRPYIDPKVLHDERVKEFEKKVQEYRNDNAFIHEATRGMK